MLFITHDLNLARKLCSRILVMKDGCVVEQGKTEEIFENPRQAYTRELIEAVPSMMKKKGLERERKGRRETAGAYGERSGGVLPGSGKQPVFWEEKTLCSVGCKLFYL